MASASTLTLSSISSLLTEDILTEVVHEICRKKQYVTSEIVSYTVTSAAGDGDGYIGSIFKITVVLENDICITLIGKGLPADLARRKVYKCATFFEREVYFYNTIVPSLKDFENHQFGSKSHESYLKIPDCYYAMADGENDFLLLEDLKPDGYNLVDKISGPNYKQIESVLKVLAQFHGLSFAMKHISPQKFNEISKMKELVFSDNDAAWIECYYQKLANIFMKSVEDYLKDTEYLKKLKTFLDPATYYKSLTRSVEYKENCVISHGDAWIANFMFNKNQVKVIDFQVARSGSPILDMSTFIFSCTNAEERDKIGGIKGILEIYQTELNRVVTSLGSPSVTFLQSEWSKLGFHGFGLSVELAVLALVEDSSRVDNQEKITMADYIPLAEITSEAGKRRLVTLVKLAVDEELI